MFSTIDLVVGTPWKLLGSVLSVVTKRSRYSIARAIAIVAVAVYAAWLISTGNPAGPIFLPIFFMFVTRTALKGIVDLEREAKHKSDVLGKASENGLWGGRLLTLSGLGMWLLIPLLQMDWQFGYGLGCIITGGAVYSALEYKPKKKRLLKRAISWLKARIPHIGTPSPAPIPT